METTVLGGGHLYYFNGIPLMHHYGEIYFLEHFLVEYDDFKHIIEFGTYKGGLSSLFGLAAYRMGADVHTFDINYYENPVFEKYRKLLPITVHGLNVFSDAAEEIVRDLMQDGRTLLYCDGGRKKREFIKYAPYLKTGDVIMAHDNPVEIRVSDIKDTINECNLAILFENELSALRSRQLCFIKN